MRIPDEKGQGFYGMVSATYIQGNDRQSKSGQDIYAYWECYGVIAAIFLQ